MIFKDYHGKKVLDTKALAAESLRKYFRCVVRKVTTYVLFLILSYLKFTEKLLAVIAFAFQQF